MASRIQLSRKKGWRMPAGAVKVCRPGKWGNPFSVEKFGRHEAIEKYRRHIAELLERGDLSLDELRGKTLACWCRLDEECHADVLLDLLGEES